MPEADLAEPCQSPDGRNRQEEAVGGVIERAKQDPELSEHEWRLLGCHTSPTPYLLTSLLPYLSNPLVGTLNGTLG